LWKRITKERICVKVFLDGYKGIHLALEVKSLSSGLSLRWVPIRGPYIRSLDLPLITIISITEREGEITCKQVNNKANPKRLRSVKLT
jgi:hypothetical protein